MTATELFKYLTEDAGFDSATADIIMKAAANEKVNTKAAALVQKKEYDDLERRAAALELSYNGTAQKPGAKTYEEWYIKNYAKVQELQQKQALYEERYGAIDVANPPARTAAAAAGATFTADDVKRIVHETIQKDGYADRWSDLVTGAGGVVQKHLLNGRKTQIDFKKLSEIASTKNGDLMAAYDEYDAPERQASEKAQTEIEIKRRVDEELAKRGTQQFFPSGADATPSTTGITRAAATEKKEYDRSKVIQAAVTGKYEPAVQ